MCTRILDEDAKYELRLQRESRMEDNRLLEEWDKEVEEKMLIELKNYCTQFEED